MAGKLLSVGLLTAQAAFRMPFYGSMSKSGKKNSRSEYITAVVVL